LYQNRRLSCSEAVVTVLNEGLGGGLPPELAVRLASGLSGGLGGVGCICGALNGGILALGLFLGREGPGLTNGKKVREAAKTLHDRFKERFGSAGCKNLTRELKKDPRLRFDYCGDLTAAAAKMTAKIILESKPELAEQADWVYLKRQDSKFSGKLEQVSELFGL